MAPKFKAPETSVFSQLEAHETEMRDAVIMLRKNKHADGIVIGRFRNGLVCVSWQDGSLEVAHIRSNGGLGFNVYPQYWQKCQLEVRDPQTLKKGETFQNLGDGLVASGGHVFFKQQLKLADGKQGSFTAVATQTVQSCVCSQLWNKTSNAPHSPDFINCVVDAVALLGGYIGKDDMHESEFVPVYVGEHLQTICGDDNVTISFLNEEDDPRRDEMQKRNRRHGHADKPAKKVENATVTLTDNSVINSNELLDGGDGIGTLLEGDGPMEELVDLDLGSLVEMSVSATAVEESDVTDESGVQVQQQEEPTASDY